MDATAAVLGGLDQAEPWLEELYRNLHRNPELSGRETATAAEVTRRLTDFGYDVQQVGGGVVGVLANGPGPTVLFRADMDGLPVRETTGLPLRSTSCPPQIIWVGSVTLTADHVRRTGFPPTDKRPPTRLFV
ncbi:hypothetical protein GCM10028820_21300 [Tessaracoccus terricola]